jgi:hypothetical protein
MGASGLIVITAPFPYSDCKEFPYKLTAITFAYTLEPHGKLNGELLKTVTGILQ